MDIYFLGTSSGVPTKQRNVSGIAVIQGDGKGWHLIDCGEGTQHQLLHAPLTLQKLRSIFITHVHGDHCYGLPGLLASAGMHGRSEPLKIIAPKGIETWINETIKQTELYLPFEVEFCAVEKLKSMEIGSLTVDATVLSHRVPSFAYRLIQREIVTQLDHDKLTAHGIPKGPIWGALQRGEDVELNGKLLCNKDWVQVTTKEKTMVICGDNDTPEMLDELMDGCDVLVHESTFTGEYASRAKEVGHSYAGLIASYAQSQSIPNLVLTHFSARYAPEGKPSPSVSDMRREAEMVYQGQLFLANDHAQYRLDSKNKLEDVTAPG